MSNETKQGDGTHLAVGSVQKQINVLREMLDESRGLNFRTTQQLIAEKERVRELEGALRDLAAPVERAVRVLEGK